MRIKTVKPVYFSPTGTTQRAVENIARAVADKLGLGYEVDDFTLPDRRKKALVFNREDLVIFGTPVYAGRVPNVLLKYLDTIEGNSALAVPVVLYGNRNYNDALIELRDIMENHRLHTVAAAAFIGEHSFSNSLAKGRPDEQDIRVLRHFANQVSKKVSQMNTSDLDKPLEVKGTPHPYRGYYQPQDQQGNSIDIRKVKPLTKDTCTDCLLCAQVCPMGSISFANVREYTGICIKCGACLKKCPVGAKYYDDEGFLYHKQELEEGLTRRAEAEYFL